MSFFILAAIIGIIPSIIADNKGYNRWVWWLFGSALFIVALPAAILLPPKISALEQKEAALGKIKCPHCAEFISNEAHICRFCNQEIPEQTKLTKKVISKKGKALGYIIGLVIIIVIFPVVMGIINAMSSSPININSNAFLLQDTYDTVAQDAVEKYNIAKQNGSIIDACTQASIVVAAFLQAKDTNNYQRWKTIQRSDCAGAGISGF